MPEIRYRLVNVFAETPFGGNPLAVIEDGSMLSDVEMQLIARQFNLSETTFLLPSSRAAARIRIFTPTYEMAFAGHPTLGSAYVVSALLGVGESFALEMEAGVIPVHMQNGHWLLKANLPTYRPFEASVHEIAAMLSLPVEAISDEAMWVNCGTEQPMIPLVSAEYVQAARPNPVLISKYSTNCNGQAKTYIFARTAQGFESRYFWMTDSTSISEDPGTGSACANLGGWWLKTQGGETLHAEIRQGTLINRPNLLTLDVENENIQVGGQVIEIGAGVLRW